MREDRHDKEQQAGLADSTAIPELPFEVFTGPELSDPHLEAHQAIRHFKLVIVGELETESDSALAGLSAPKDTAALREDKNDSSLDIGYAVSKERMFEIFFQGHLASQDTERISTIQKVFEKAEPGTPFGDLINQARDRLCILAGNIEQANTFLTPLTSGEEILEEKQRVDQLLSRFDDYILDIDNNSLFYDYSNEFNECGIAIQDFLNAYDSVFQSLSNRLDAQNMNMRSEWWLQQIQNEKDLFPQVFERTDQLFTEEDSVISVSRFLDRLRVYHLDTMPAQKDADLFGQNAMKFAHLMRRASHAITAVSSILANENLHEQDEFSHMRRKIEVRGIRLFKTGKALLAEKETLSSDIEEEAALMLGACGEIFASLTDAFFSQHEHYASNEFYAHRMGLVRELNRTLSQSKLLAATG